MKTKLHYWRTIRNKTMRELAADASTNPKTINDIENGYAKPHARTRAKLVKALGIQPLEFFTSDNDPEADGNWKNPAKEEPPAA